MSEPYIGEIRMFGGNFAPSGWAFCNGQQLSISENDALFALLGTTFGGDGQTTFALPDLRGRIPVHAGTNPATGTAYTLGAAGGVETVTLVAQQLPAHNHQALAVANGTNVASPQGALWASGPNAYSTNAPNTAMAGDAITGMGSSLPHDNTMPFQCVNFIIALTGLFPQQS
jgi:microcystin-dependent protein